MKAAFFIIFAVIGQLAAQNVNINCNFVVTNGIYTCHLQGITVADNQNANFIIAGIHTGGRNNNHVIRIQIATSSSIPFIIPQLFSAFVNVEMLDILSSNLLRIQSNAFANARWLERISISGNNNFREIQANAFNGAQRLNRLDIFQTGLSIIHEQAFNGLGNLQFLLLDDNFIRDLPVNVFRPLTSLVDIVLLGNDLHSIDGRLLEANTLLISINLDNNLIERVGRNFFDTLTRLQHFDFRNNRCANGVWTIGGATSIQTIRQALSTCFNNSIEVPGDELRRFVLELRGSLVIRNENGTEVGRL